MASKNKKDPYSTRGLNDKAAVQQALAAAEYQPGAAVSAAASDLAQLQSSRPADDESQYQGQIDSLLDQAMERESFSYNHAADPLYRQYAQAYRQSAHDASTDAAAQAASLTGGYGSSYAASAAQQAYQQQMNGLNSIIPTLYSLALDSYTSEGDRLMDEISALSAQEQSAQDRYYRQLEDYYARLEQGQAAYEAAYAQDYGEYTDYLNNLNSLYGYYSQQEEAEAARNQQTFNNVMSVLGLLGNAAQLAISGTTGLGSLVSGLAQAGYGIYADSRDYEAARADAAWEQQMQERMYADGLSRQSYEDSLAAQQYQDALSQQQFDNDVASQKLAIAQGEWALKRSQAEQEAAAASLRAAGRAAGGSTGAGSSPSGGGTGSTGSTGATAGSAAPAASSGGIDYQTFANQMRSRGYTIAEIKEMFDLLRANR